MITIIDYEAGNLTSVKRALDHLKIDSEITNDPDKISNSKKIIFPGVGNAASAMAMLKKSGIGEAIKSAFKKGTPILGICLGTQIILSHSDEGDTDCLGLLDGNCPKFELKNKDLKIPHMGWNKVKFIKKHFIFRDLPENAELYFVHSYYPDPADRQNIFALTEYGIEFASVIGNGNLVATQFHLEKSGEVGLGVLKNFSTWDGRI
jgi:imidazole glycerol-phosphate synthase subunit HisH